MLLLISFCFNCGVGFSEGPEVFFFRDHFGYGPSEMSILLLTGCLATLFLAPSLAALASALGEIKSCMFSSFGLALVNLFLVLGTGIKWVPCAYAGLAVGFFGNLFVLGYMSLVHQLCPKDELSFLLGLKSFIDSFAGTFSPVVGGLLYAGDHFRPYGVTCGFLVVTAGLFASTAPLQEKAISDEEVEPMLPQVKSKQDDRGDGEASPFLGDPLPQGKASFCMKLYANQLNFTLNDRYLSLFYKKNKHFRDQQGLKKGVTIGVENFAQGIDDSSPLLTKTMSASAPQSHCGSPA